MCRCGLPIRSDPRRNRGEPIAIVLPGNTHEVASIVKICYEFGIVILPQGGNPCSAKEKNNMVKFSAVSRETLGTTVYNEIRNAILNGDFGPGEFVRIRHIAEQMGVSNTPVRDALLQLVMERVLIMPNSREIRVPLISRKDFDEIRILRTMLEGLTAEQAAKCTNDTDINRLEEINEKIRKAFDRNKPKQALSHNRAFHAYLYSIADMNVTIDILDRLWLRMAPLIAAWSETADIHDFSGHHVTVIDALKNKDGKTASKAISEDIMDGGKKIEALFTRYGWA